MPKPFDPEAAKRGELIESCNGIPLHFVGFLRDGRAMVEPRAGSPFSCDTDALRMSDPPRRVWLNVYEGLVAVHNSKQSSTANATPKALIIAIGIEIAADGTASIFQQGERR